MDLQEKLDALKKDVIDSIQKQKTEIFINNIFELKNQLENDFEKYIYNAIEKIKIKKNQLEYQNIKTIADYKLNLKKNLLSLRIKNKKQIFDEIENKIKLFIKSDDYFKYIYNQLKELKQKNNLNNLTIEFSCLDKKLIDYINNKDFDYNFILSKENFLGGYRIYLVDKKIIIDKSFKAYLENIKHNFDLFKIPVF